MTGTYTLTGASDWPMLVSLLKTMAWIFGAMLSVIAALIVGLWADFRRQYASHKVDEAESCSGCHDALARELDAVWDALEACCPRGTSRPVRCKRKTDRNGSG